MSLVYTEPLLRRFVSGDLRRPDGSGITLALTGAWGVGKTHLWNRVVREVAADGVLGRGRYAYVSLFGLNSLDEVRAELVARRRTADDLDPYDQELPEQALVRKTKSAVSPYLRRLKDHPLVTATLGPSVAEAIAFDVFGRETLVCFDDLERRGRGLALADVFGLATQLRDERSCDVLFVLNDDQLGDAAAEYAAHGEKAVDLRVRFSPTPSERFGVVFKDGYPNRELVHECCLKLRVSNVRMLQQIDRALREVEGFLGGHRPETVEEVVRIVVLLVWAYHVSEGDAPPYERVKLGKTVDAMDDVISSITPEEKRSDEDRALAELWTRYGPVDGGLVRFEVALLVERGWFDREAFGRHLDRRDKEAVRRAGRASLAAAWELYHAGFGDNGDEVARALAEAVQEHGSRVSLREAGNAIGLVRRLGYGALADKMVDRYMPGCLRFLRHGDRVSIARVETLNDPVLDQRVRDVIRQRDDRMTLAEAMADVAGGDSWGGDSPGVIRAATADEVEGYLRAADLSEAQRAVRWCLRGDTEDRRAAEIAGTVLAALRQIAEASAIDRVRVESWFGADTVSKFLESNDE